jgi:hypothetical protein
MEWRKKISPLMNLNEALASMNRVEMRGKIFEEFIAR